MRRRLSGLRRVPPLGIHYMGTHVQGGTGSHLPVFEDVLARWDWKPIRNCAGRYVLSRGASRLSLEELLGGHVPAAEFASSVARDRVLIARLRGGGVICYIRSNGEFLHTLGTRAAFERKLIDLGLMPRGLADDGDQAADRDGGHP